MVVKCIVSYDGSNYCGWQVQPNLLTIQGEIERVLSMIMNRSVSIVGSGRTDSKVHALGQVFSFVHDKEMSCIQLKTAMNRLLPKDIRILSVSEVSDNFHARFDAIHKRYDYYVSFDMENPFIRHYMAIINQPLDTCAMQEAAHVFLGTHDFTSFTSAKIHQEKNRVRQVTRCEIVAYENYLQMIFEGDSFLRYQIRMMAAVLIEVGLHRLTCDEVKKMLEACDKHACRYKADPCGLYLVSVDYKE